MDRLDLVRKRIEDLIELNKPELLPQNEMLKAYNAGYALALKHVLEMFDF